jgi:hypothetical protein
MLLSSHRIGISSEIAINLKTDNNNNNNNNNKLQLSFHPVAVNNLYVYNL